MSDRKIRWGVLSTADIGLGAVIPAIQSSDLGEVVAISSRDADRAGRAAADLGIPTAHGSYEALLDDPAVDAVYNPLPNHLHAEWTMKAADAGKHVLCEKPLAMSSEQAQLMVDHCAAAGVKLQEAFMYRFHPQWRRVKEIVDSGELGELRAIQAWFSFFNDDGSDIRNVPEWGGGGLMDIGCYPISISRWLFGAEPDDVAAASFHHPDFGVDVVTSALMRFGEVHATFTCSTLTEWGQRLFVEGAEGRIEIPIPFNPRPDRPTEIRIHAGGVPPNDVDITTIEFPPADHYALQCDAFAAAILDGTPVPTPPDDAVANMRVIERVVEAAG